MEKTKTIDEQLLSKKRKTKSSQQPPSAKRHKSEYSERFKFVLAPNNSDDEEITVKNKKSDISNIYESPSESNDDDSYSWLDEDMESFSEEYEEEDEYEDSEEWDTDTDYSDASSEYSFHESDCEEISNDSDYKPPIEDKYIKKGEAIIYDAKGLHIAFGDTSESQIVEINDLNIDLNDDEDPPTLVDENGVAVVNKEIESQEDEKVQDEFQLEFNQLLHRVKFYDCVDDQGVVICLNKTIHFLGILEVCPLYNCVQVNGFTIETGQSLKVSSISHANYFLNLSPVITSSAYCEIKLMEELKSLVPDKIDDIMANFDRNRNVLIQLKKSVLSTSVEFLKNTFPYAILPHKNTILKNSVCSSSELILSSKFFVSEENPRLNCFRVNEDWKYIKVKSDSRIVVVGGKNTGKSTLAQYLINQYIAKFGKILLIDLDIGQPICAVSQTVSATILDEPIIGPGYLNVNRKQIKCLLFGDKSITNQPFKYIECVHHLIAFCHNQQEQLSKIPWVINTLGYQKGFGTQLLTVILKIIQPTDVVQIQHSNAKYNFECVINENIVNKSPLSFFEEKHLLRISKESFFTTHVISSTVNNRIQNDDESVWISNAAEKRKISLLAHFSRLLRNGQTYLNEVVPRRVAMDHIRMIIIDEEFENEEAAKLELFNGNLIYLCTDSPLENSILECHGVGLVRAIDKINGYMYILLPEDLDEKLCSVVSVIAIASIPLPSDILMKQSFSAADGTIPYVTFSKNRATKKYMNKRNIKDCY